MIFIKVQDGMAFRGQQKTELKPLDNAVCMALQKFYKGNPQTIEGLKEFVENFKCSKTQMRPLTII